jgi:ribosomal protein S18 acetylase RimI-like enzyme
MNNNHARIAKPLFGSRNLDSDTLLGVCLGSEICGRCDEIDARQPRPLRQASVPARSSAMNSSVTVRTARSTDEAELGRLGAMLVAEHHDFDPRRFIAPIPNLAERYGQFLLSRVEREGMLVLVAEREGEVVGYAYAGMEGNDYMALRGPAGVLYDLVVDPAHRRQGIGSALMDAALDRLRELGAPRVLLFTADRNHGAQSMFDRAGFRRTMIEMTREI